VQGEVIRIAGRVGDELLDNRGINWDGDYRAMAKALFEHLQSGSALSAPEIDELRTIVPRLGRGSDDDNCMRMAKLSVAWVLLNPKPVPLSKPSYRR
jgi:hypothetical protein